MLGVQPTKLSATSGVYCCMDTESDLPETPPIDDAFARLRFAGGRFNSHTIPLEVLPDLAAYRKLIVEVAKMLFKQRVGTRVRVPKGFEDSFMIGLAEVQGGSSAVAVMPRLSTVARPAPQQSLGFAANQPSFNSPQYPEFDEARDYIDNLIDSVGTTGQVPREFPVELAGFFNSFGQSLQHDEFVELGYGGAKPVRYDTLIRKKIVLSRETTYENAVDDQFVLNGGVSTTGTIHVLHESGSSYDFQPATEFEFKKAYQRATETVRLVGTGLYDKNERLKRLIAVTIVYSEGGAIQPFEARLEEIAATPAGWYDGENPAPSPAAVEAMRQFLEEVSLLSSPLPHLYPIPSGGVVAEWSLGDWEASAEVVPSGEQLALNAVNTTTADELDMLVGLNSPDLMKEFKSFMGAISSEEGPFDAS